MGTLHKSAFEFLSPSESQKEQMAICRRGAADFANLLDEHVPAGPDKTYLLRKLREVAMWANIAITRKPDGEPTSD